MLKLHTLWKYIGKDAAFRNQCFWLVFVEPSDDFGGDKAVTAAGESGSFYGPLRMFTQDFRPVTA